MKFRAPFPILLPAVVASPLSLGVADLTFTWPGRNGSDGNAAREVLRARRFELVDPAGKVRGVMSVGPTGPQVSLLDEAGQVRATMFQTPEGEYGFGVFDPKGTQRVGVSTTGRGFVGLGMRDASGTFRANMQVADDGSHAGFRTADEHDSRRTFLGLLNDGSRQYGIAIEGSDGQVWKVPPQ
jgi:hypothetical protein